MDQCTEVLGCQAQEFVLYQRKSSEQEKCSQFFKLGRFFQHHLGEGFSVEPESLSLPTPWALSLGLGWSQGRREGPIEHGRENREIWHQE